MIMYIDEQGIATEKSKYERILESRKIGWKKSADNPEWQNSPENPNRVKRYNPSGLLCDYNSGEYVPK